MPLLATDTAPATALTNPLDQLRGIIRRYVLADGLLTAGLFLVVWFWLGLALDYGLFKATNFDWVLDAPKSLRIIALAALAILLLGILVTRLAFRLTKQFSYTSLALVLEKRFPTILGDRLITAVELADVAKARDAGYSEAMLRQTIADAHDRIRQVPVESVFDWRRLRVKGVLLAAFALGTLGLVFSGYALITGVASPGTFGNKFGDVAIVWGQRNLLLHNTPWPRSAHIELLKYKEFVGKDATAPEVQVRAYKWVISDRGAVHGWRPMNWRDVGKQLAKELPALPGMVGNDGMPLPAAAAQWDLDRIEAAAGRNEGLKGIFAQLGEMADKPRMSRRLRKLDIPEVVTLAYFGAKTAGRVSLTREANNEFVGRVEGLKESVRFTVRGSDFATLPKSITLVPPPVFRELKRTEYAPAYLYHAAPETGDVAAAPDATRLRGLRQTLAPKPLSLTGDKSVFAIVNGTEFTLNGVADKSLKKIEVKPKLGKLPGRALGALEPIVLEPAGSEHDSFSIAFRGADRPTTNLEFDLVLSDDYDVTSTRTVFVQVTEDQPPQVDLAVDVLRKLGNAYMVTPIATVPFLTDSKVRDDLALAKVEFVFTYSQMEAQVVLAVQAQTLAGIWASAPLMPNIGGTYASATTAILTQSMTRSDSKQTGAWPLERFAEQYRTLKRDTPAGLAARLAIPLPEADAQVVREVKFQNQNSDVFDLQKALPKLVDGESAELQQRYRIEMNLVATDANVETGPKTGQSLEPVRLLVVSEADLLTEISKDEESQAGKLDDVLKKLKDAQTKLNQTTDRLFSAAPPPDVMQSSAVRAADIAQDIAKGREITASVAQEYRRLFREGEFNRIGIRKEGGESEFLKRLTKEVLTPLESILENGFIRAEKTHADFQTALAENRRPDDGLMAADKTALADLIRDLDALRQKLGEAVNLSKVRTELLQLIARQQEVGKMLKRIKVAYLDRLSNPTIRPVPVVELSVGSTVTVKHTIDWNTFLGSGMTVKLEGPASGLTMPAEVKVTEDKDELAYNLTAGTTPGEYTVKLVPSAGPPVEVRVLVKK